MTFPAPLAHLKLPGSQPDLAGIDESQDVTWLYGWRAGQQLSAELSALVDCAGKRVADLGCGRGHCGLNALMGGAASVTFADCSLQALAWIDQVLDLNGLATRAQTHQHHWGQPLPGAPFDLIVGGDILYRPELFTELIATIAASLGQAGVCLLSDPRERLEQELPTLGLMHGLSWSQERRQAGYTLVRAKMVVAK
jgi:predicted nicotinamide N-methyase